MIQNPPGRERPRRHVDSRIQDSVPLLWRSVPSTESPFPNPRFPVGRKALETFFLRSGSGHSSPRWPVLEGTRRAHGTAACREAKGASVDARAGVARQSRILVDCLHPERVVATMTNGRLQTSSLQPLLGEEGAPRRSSSIPTPTAVRSLKRWTCSEALRPSICTQSPARPHVHGGEGNRVRTRTSQHRRS